MGPALPARALCRAPDDAYARCLRDGDVGIDVAAARAQHEAYVEALRGLGVPVEVLAPDPAAPDGCFVEDVAIVLEDRALATIPGAPSRRAEVDAVAAALARTLRVERMRDGTLDGGDVLRVGDRWLVGRSARTDEAGIHALAAFVPGEVVPIDVERGLHLKSAATALDARTVLVDAAAIDPARFEALGLATVRAPEPLGANVLVLGEAALVSDAAPRTGEQLAARGLRVVPLAVPAFHAGDGALSCLSLRVPAPGTWCV